MKMQTRDYRALGDVSYAFWEAELRRVNSPLLTWSRELYEVLRGHTALALAHMWRECQYETDRKRLRVEDHNAFNMKAWMNRIWSDEKMYLNGRQPIPMRAWADFMTPEEVRAYEVVPTGLEGDDPYLVFDSPVSAARQWRRRVLDDPRYKNGAYTEVRALDDYIETYAPSKDYHADTGVDNSSYYGDMVKILTRFAAEDTGEISPVPTIPKEPIPMVETPYALAIPGLSGGPLRTTFKLELALLPASNTYIRPGLLLRGEFESTQHTTGNRGTGAVAEKNYLLGGSGGRQASWHATVDDGIGFIHLPFNEVGWHAGDGAGPGNYSTVACELTMADTMVNNPARWRKARRNAAELLGRTAARKGADDDGQFHKRWSGKWCPEAILRSQTWIDEYNADYSFFHADERARMAGGNPAPVDPVINIGDTIKVLVELNLRQRATTLAPVLTKLPVGATAKVSGRFESADGYGWLPVTTTLGSGVTVNGFVAMGDSSGPWVEKVAAPPVVTLPTYVKPSPIPGLLETDLQYYDTAKGISTSDTGKDFIFVADVIEFEKETVAGEYALVNPRPVKAPYKVGERAIAAWLVEGEGTGPKEDDTDWYYVLAGPGDEWIRVPYANTKRISDAPLLPTKADLA